MGVLHSVIAQAWPPKSKFSVQDIPDMSGKTVIVTGANTGLGKETAKVLLSKNAKVYMVCRSEEKGNAAIEELFQETGKRGILLRLDLADLKSVKAGAEVFLSKESELHVLFNNAGVMAVPVSELTADGYDLQFGVSVIAHFYLTKLLLPTLIHTATLSADGKARVVNTASLAHEFVSPIDFNTFKDCPQRKEMSTDQLYAHSKLGNVIFATELARRYGDKGIVSTSLNPGNIRTDIQRHLKGLKFLILDWVDYDPPYGVLTQLYAGTSPEGASFNGKYLIPWARIGTATAVSQNPEVGTDLWNWLEEQVKDI
ncbi:hypothetical protein AMATHDRAFT_148897 [Amanita thiersii Skay4041]|uniref:NAD(P)-binding protein n=1 Tax=Amanita thiersii Skay4041 TaxID=703135 RepID=A0A2A9NE18_9AGAR|nr:hypothetical protein AMATHDRAFT_148897 [Amanita thiersii Skay4041]